jgi:hypothetical protein
MRLLIALIVATFAGTVFAKLPPATEQAKTLAAETAAKTAWSDKVALYQLCMSMDRTADAYRRRLKEGGEAVPPAAATAPCTNPGAYVSPAQPTPVASKPLEASGAHSPPGTAVSPPSTKATAAEMTSGTKK